MNQKKLIRKKFFLKRKKKYFAIKRNFFSPLIPLMKKLKKKNISIYYPNSYEVNVLQILEIKFFKKLNFLLPGIDENNNMNFYFWKKSDVLKVNKYGILEPLKNIKSIPNIVLVPLLAFDKQKNRLGYGKGFYDKYLSKYKKIYKTIITVGVAFSFQKHNKLPINKNDVKMDFILTEKGIC